MYMPVPKGAVRRNPMQVRESQKFMFAAINVVLGTIGFSIYGLYHYLQNRSRGASDEAAERLLEDGSGNRVKGLGGPLAGLLDQSAPRRVIVVGASAAGATTAAMLVKGDPSLEVVVFDEQRRVMLNVMAPYAQVGHRSYDLTTSGSPDTLSSPTTWTITRDAKLVPKGIAAVVADRNVVIDTDGVEHRYDALVIASGSERDVDGCGIKGISEATIDKHRVCYSPHITRDTLQTIWEGNVVCAKVSTRHHNYQKRLCCEGSLAEGKSGRAGGEKEYKEVSKALLAMRKENEKMRELASVSSPAAALLKESCKSTKSLSSVTSSSTTASSPLSWADAHYSSQFIKGSGPMVFDRSCDVAFVSSINILWKFLQHFNKLHRMPVSVYSDEAGPCDGLGHVDYTRQVMSLWAKRDIPFFGGQRLVEVDVLNGEATFESFAMAPAAPLTSSSSSSSTSNPTAQCVRSKVPYKLLFLDLPRKAPSFIADSGLSATEADGFVAVDPTTLQHLHHKNVFAVGDCAALPTMKSYGAVFTQVPVVTHNVIQYLNNLKKLPLIDALSLSEGCQTHLALSPSDAISTVKATEGGAKSTSPTVVSTSKKRSSSEASKEKARIFSLIPTPTAKYDGYSTAPVVMTTWRLMWPERRYDAAEVHNPETNGYTYPGFGDTNNNTKGGESSSLSSTSHNLRINCHKWDNAEWEGVRGLLNGVYFQLFGYEVMYWFVFLRGHWHPPTWWRPAKFPEDSLEHDAVPSFDRVSK